jgi:diguanylate cyclase (GGDEF)-like protein
MWESLLRDGYWQGEIWDRRKNGEIHPKWMTITAVKGEAGTTTHYVSTHNDITERKLAEDEIKLLAFYDPLTGLPNRRLLLDRLHQALAASARSQKQGALFFIDLDNFKTLNDTLGHDKGDMLLQQVAQRLLDCVREGDTVARLGGDEFVVMLENLSADINEAAAQLETVGEKILADLNWTYLLSGHEYHGTSSIGVTLFGKQEKTVEALLKQADLAMYQAKAGGRNALRFFDPQMQTMVTARAALETDLRNAVREGQFLLHYQAQVDTDGRLMGAEALVRWQHPQRGMVLPDDFIPLAEETGLILPLGLWVLESACAQLAAWSVQEDAAYLTLAVNISVQQIHQPDFVEHVLAVLDHTGANPSKLQLELTESLFMEDVEDTIAKMTALKARGVGFALDDFGTGYSSLTYLKRLPLEKLKIDRSFVMDVLTDPNDAAIAKTIVALGQSLGLSVIAEGVETEAHRDFLARNGCHAYQGYLFSRPLPLAEFEQYLKREQGRTASRPPSAFL